MSEDSISVYTKVNDKKVCHYKEEKGEDKTIESCEYLCDEPNNEIKTKLLTCADYEHLFFQIDEKWFSTWEAMTKVGGFSGLGNKKGIVEWIFKNKDNKKRENLEGLIVRFDGVQNNKNNNALAVFELSKKNICWKGNFSDNAKARLALKNESCKEVLEGTTKLP